MRAVSVISVASAAQWPELEAMLGADALQEHLSETQRVLPPAAEKALIRASVSQGLTVLFRNSRRSKLAELAAAQDLAETIASLRFEVREVLYRAQRHALGDLVLAWHAWDPLNDLASVRALFGAGLLRPELPDQPVAEGRYRLHPDLPPPPPHPDDFSEAAMDETDDRSPASPGPVGLLHDLAALAAAIEQVRPTCTLQGSITRTDLKKLGKRLGVPELGQGPIDEHPRWNRALRALEALGGVSTDPITRELHLELGLEPTLAGSTPEAVDRFVHRLVDADLHTALPALRAALAAAGEGAVDELVFFELLAEQHREVLLSPWNREGRRVYPAPETDARTKSFDADGWEQVEERLLNAVLTRAQKIGLIRRAPGVFAGTADGRAWAADAELAGAQVWLTSDLELIVPPGGLTPWERFQVERLSQGLARDTVDRLRLDRAGLVHWLSTHELDEALDLLHRRCVAVPPGAVDALTAWADAASRLCVTRGVLLD